MKCVNCGTEFEEGIFCPECGTKIEEIKDPPKLGDKIKNSICEWVIIIAIAIVGIICTELFTNSSNTDEIISTVEVVEETTEMIEENTEETVETPEVDNEKTADYPSIYGEVVADVQSTAATQGEPIEYLRYILYDMDQDGYKELFISNRAMPEEGVYEVYTTDGNAVTMLGTIVGDCNFYEVENGYGVYVDYCGTRNYASYEYINLVYSKDGNLIEEMVFEQENGVYGFYSGRNGEKIRELKYPIETKYVNEFENEI